jgi:hypothetical protein
MTRYDDDVLAESVLGTLEEAERIAIEEAAGHSASLRAAIDAMRELLCVLPTELGPVGPSAELWARLEASTARTSRFADFVERVAEMLDVARGVAAAMLERLDEPERWGPGLVPGMTLINVEGGARVANAVAGFVRLDPGTAFPEHRHVGHERVLFLQGAVREDDGRVLRAGDYAEQVADSLPGVPVIFFTTIEGGVWIGDTLVGPDSPYL